ncbi:uncharacterized protein LOC106755091 isoform X2 [Vigna radiata var. radiata]|uniref:Uncharacterized protein LOC106755091 isoform X2 n=1 Tax=Vigna radiata var. radiata TaxID=3916 RepID=A0A3Q0ETU1_VIGRR|nr:uncharacterized protein LOC106755091 isoform X2 [Vigna radiata var. radiata]
MNGTILSQIQCAPSSSFSISLHPAGAERGPILSSLFYATILSHDCLEQALAFALANRLQKPTFLATQLMDIFSTVMKIKVSNIPFAWIFSSQADDLAQTHPSFLTLQSMDLSPTSWTVVSWYLIYIVPSRNNEKELEVCFLTYHTLPSSFEAKLLLGNVLKEGTTISINPLVIWAWAGLLINAINSIPAGELDGGRISFALWGRKAL